MSLVEAIRHLGWRLSEVVQEVPGLSYNAAAQGSRRIWARCQGKADEGHDDSAPEESVKRIDLTPLDLSGMATVGGGEEVPGFPTTPRPSVFEESGRVLPGKRDDGHDHGAPEWIVNNIDLTPLASSASALPPHWLHRPIGS